MPRRHLQQLTDDAYVWIFGVSPALDESGEAKLLHRVNGFLEGWASHGQPIESASGLVERTFLVIAAEKTSERSGCSIDRLFGTLRELEHELAVRILDSDRVFFRHGDGRVDAMSRASFRDKADMHTIVFDTTAETLREVRTGAWERPAAQSWHRELLNRPVVA